MWSIRMRASQIKGTSRRCELKTGQGQERHISGAEGIYEEHELPTILREYAGRALSHPRGKPDSIIMTLEALQEEPRRIPLLGVETLPCRSPAQARRIITSTLLSLAVSSSAIEGGLSVLLSPNAMRGAALIRADSGRRADPDRERGVRVSRLGIDRSSLRKMQRMLSGAGIDTITVREALILASKVVSAPQVIAEVCFSDDPDYTTGYIASRNLGYRRIPHVKKMGSPRGGRVLFIAEDADVEKLVSYLERMPVLTVC
ncbi:MAG TPA: 6-carboxyhexanoate--CoA ligase [Dissulfurispiraceae bacterium]|nr:6-carboxyhexanoate--CoA ligase [Dissulfurispiraceae bacterium]